MGSAVPRPIAKNEGQLIRQPLAFTVGVQFCPLNYTIRRGMVPVCSNHGCCHGCKSMSTSTSWLFGRTDAGFSGLDSVAFEQASFKLQATSEQTRGWRSVLPCDVVLGSVLENPVVPATRDISRLSPNSPTRTGRCQGGCGWGARAPGSFAPRGRPGRSWPGRGPMARVDFVGHRHASDNQNMRK